MPGRINDDGDGRLSPCLPPVINVFMLPEAGMACYCGKMTTSMEGAGTRTWNAAPLPAGFPGRQVLAATKEAPHARGRSLWAATPPCLPLWAPYLCTIPLIARFKMTKRDGAVGRNEVFGMPNKDKLLAKDVKRVLVLIYRTTRPLELPY